LTSPQPLPQEGGAIDKLDFTPLLSWEKGPGDEAVNKKRASKYNDCLLSLEN